MALVVGARIPDSKRTVQQMCVSLSSEGGVAQNLDVSLAQLVRHGAVNEEHRMRAVSERAARGRLPGVDAGLHQLGQGHEKSRPGRERPRAHALLPFLN